MRSTLTGFALLFALAGSVAGQGRVIQSPDPGGLALSETVAGYRIETPRGAGTPIEVPAGTVFSSFRGLSEGWVAAGHRTTETGEELIILRSNGVAIERLEPPDGAHGLRRAPALLVEAGRLTGLAWLEGDGGEKNAVMASQWTGNSWQPAETVSPPTGEAQLALSAAVLDDGSSLLVWAAVVGGDDDVFWSRLDSGAWTPPRRAHPDNDVPDIVPRVAAVNAGAVMAWSQYDGRDYRLRVSRFANDAWLETGFDSEAGAGDPTLFPNPDGAGFLYQTTAPRAWALVEVEADGSPSRRALTGRVPGGTRPLVFPDPSGTVQLRFLAETPEGLASLQSVPWLPPDRTLRP